MRCTLQPAYILHSRAFNETSAILDVLTATHGRIGLLAKGVRMARPRFRGLLRPFVPVLLSWSGKTELMNLSAAEPAGAPLNLVGHGLISGIYYNELLVRLLPRFDPCPNIFAAYERLVVGLQNKTIHELQLRLFEKELISELGYGFALDHETANGHPILAAAYYEFIPARGLNRCPPDYNSDAVFKGKSLLAFHKEAVTTPEDLRAIKRLMRIAINTIVAGKTLRTREFFYQL